MAVGTDTVAVRYEGIVAGTPISVPYPVYEALDVRVYYGFASLLAVYNTDYMISLADDFDTFTLTPTASLLAKIDALIALDPTREENYITVRRHLDYLTDSTAAAVRYTPFTSREFERTVLRFQQIQEQLNRALVLSPNFVGSQPLLQLTELQPGASLKINDEGTAIEAGPQIPDIDEQADRAEAEANRARDEADYAQEWAQSPSPISVAAGGDGVTDQSSKTWALRGIASSESAALSSAAAGASSGRLDVASFGELATKFVYSDPSTGQQQVAAGDVILWREKGLSWKVALSDATDQQLDYTGAGGVKLYVAARSGRTVTPESFGVLDDGDVTVDEVNALQALAAFTRAKRLGTSFGPREYRTSGNLLFGASVFGCGPDVTIIQYLGSPSGGNAFFRIDGPGAIHDLTSDGNASDDPASWNSSNYDSFTGSRGVSVESNGVAVRRVIARNCNWAGFASYGRSRITYEDCQSMRTRGNFGDGFFFAGGTKVSFKNCRAYDFTRIGYVTDTTGTGYSARAVFKNCEAEYGHDASILYGGVEYNVGFWSEMSGQVIWDNCHVKDTTHDGYRMVSGADPDGLNVAVFTARSCTATDVAGGFVGESLSGVPVRFSLTNCFADASADAYSFVMAGAQSITHLTGCSSRLRGASVVRSSVKVGAGVLIVDGFHEEWADINTTLRDAQDNYYGSVSHFNNAPGKVTIRDWKTVDAAGNQIGSVFKFLSPARPSLELKLEGCYVRGVATECKDYITEDCVFERTGYVRFSRRLHVKGGAIRDSGIAYYYRDTSEEALLDGVFLDLAASGGSVGFYNDNSAQASIKARLKGCKIRKNFEANGSAVRINAEASVLNTTGANHIVLDGCVVENTGGSTSNPIVQIDSPTGAASRVMGYGNLKSSSLSVIAKAGHVSPSTEFGDIG